MGILFLFFSEQSPRKINLIFEFFWLDEKKTFLKELCEIEANEHIIPGSIASSSTPLIPMVSPVRDIVPPTSPQANSPLDGISSPPKRVTVSLSNMSKKPMPSSAPILNGESNLSLSHDLDPSGESLDSEASTSAHSLDDDVNQPRPGIYFYFLPLFLFPVPSTLLSLPLSRPAPAHS